MARHFTNRSIKMTELPEHVRRNRAHWDQLAPQFVSAGEHGWAINEPNWGIWSVPEWEVPMFPEDLVGKDVIELGCGTAYVSCWLARRARAWFLSTIPSNNSLRPGVSSGSTTSTSHLFTVTQSLSHTPIQALILPFRNTALAFGPTRIDGSRRQRGY